MSAIGQGRSFISTEASWCHANPAPLPQQDVDRIADAVVERMKAEAPSRFEVTAEDVARWCPALARRR